MLSFLNSDTDECSETPNICGLGSCVNGENGMFYDCVCPDGSEPSGSNVDATLTCNGNVVIYPIFSCYLIFLRYQ